MRFVLERDAAKRFRFTPIQSDYGRALAKAAGIDPENPDTNAVVWGGEIYRRSDAALRVVSLLPGWGWVRASRVVPRPLRDLVYRGIARNRYGLFGRHDVCDLGGRDHADRVITGITQL